MLYPSSSPDDIYIDVISLIPVHAGRKEIQVAHCENHRSKQT